MIVKILPERFHYPTLFTTILVTTTPEDPQGTHYSARHQAPLVAVAVELTDTGEALHGEIYSDDCAEHVRATLKKEAPALVKLLSYEWTRRSKLAAAR